MKTTSIAEAKARFSELVGEVAHGGPPVIITKRGRPVARIVSVEQEARPHLAAVEGWLEDDDPFFDEVEAIVSDRVNHPPRNIEL